MKGWPAYNSAKFNLPRLNALFIIVHCWSQWLLTYFIVTHFLSFFLRSSPFIITITSFVSLAAVCTLPWSYFGLHFGWDIITLYLWEGFTQIQQCFFGNFKSIRCLYQEHLAGRQKEQRLNSNKKEIVQKNRCQLETQTMPPYLMSWTMKLQKDGVL